MPSLSVALPVLAALVVLVLLVVFARRWRARRVAGPAAARVDLSGKTILVTGASPGSLGFESARILASYGANVVITTRTAPSSAAEAVCAQLAPEARGRVTSHALDLADAASVETFAAWFLGAHDSLDVLLNNAGIHLDLLSQWNEAHRTSDGFEIQWRTNYLGTMHLTHRLLPLLERTGRARGDARVVNVVSALHSKGTNAGLFTGAVPYDSWVAYGLSKLAMVHATFELERRYASASNVHAYCLHPGSVFTKVASKGLAGNPVLETTRNLLAPFEAFFLKTPEEGAQTQVFCASSPSLLGGRYFRECRSARASTEADDAAVSAKLFDETAAWVRGLDAPAGSLAANARP